MDGAGLVQLNSMPAMLLYCFLVCAVYWDLHRRRVPNILSVGLACAGLAVNAWIWQLDTALFMSLGGLVVGFLAWLPPYLLRLAGGGDVKLAAAVGVWLGPLGALRASVYAALAGGVLALLWLWWHRGVLGGWVALRLLPVTLRTRGAERSAENRPALPFALAIAAGAAFELAGLSLF